ncbi:MAG TPA: tetratricopeptide repeat protein [Gemmatimonadales bacterium]|jgi:tetratricopeptide (TPR) repeat protein|nr:tetratricopeptide repeat protein [Gemmatimonadales bacterium]
MSEAFLSSDEFDEQAHQLYNEGRYDDALNVLKEGIALYPHAVELHIGKAYAHLAREEYAWSRRSFDSALGLDPDHEDGLAGIGETLLKLGDREGALRSYERILQLGFQDDHELMLQVGRALFREGLIAPAHRFFDLAAASHPESPDAAACLGYAAHRLGNDAGSLYWLRRALELEPTFAEARIYLANLLYDRGETEAALHHLERTQPEDHFDELGIWRHVELKKSVYRLPDEDPELKPWLARLAEVAGDPDATDMLLAEVEASHADGGIRDPHQLELFGTLLSELHAMQKKPGLGDSHLVVTLTGQSIRGDWEQILLQMKAADREWAQGSLTDFMTSLARRGQAETGVVIPTTDAEAFIRGSAQAGVLRIVQ